MKIISWLDLTTLYEDDCGTMKETLEKAAKLGARLDGARLDGARLVNARLDGASLVNASLDGARLDGASLVNASLDGARLVNASLDGARLDGASLVNARLDGASLVNASLDGARLVNASLVNASLDGARLDGASLRTADLVRIKDDFFTVLDAAAAEVPALLAALRAGHINGSAYEGECSCLKGTIATARGVSYKTMQGPLAPNVKTPAEAWFLGIKKNYKPDNSQVASITEEWILEWQGKHPITPCPAAL